MSSVQDRKAPGAGTKVDPGRKAPITQEGAGFVDPESLAADSSRHGGAFSGNRVAQDEKTSPNVRSGHSEGTSRHGGNSATAPAYVADQYLADHKGPHGKNLKEGGFDDSRITDGLKKALDSEPGSMDDPSRLAEAKMARNAAAGPSVSGHKDTKLSTATAFDGLDRETSS